jgi:BASS family bile acid:Na+ symporter
VRAGFARIPDLLMPLALVAAGGALLFPWPALSDRSDVLLAVLVLVTALGIPAADLLALRTRTRELVVLSIAPFVLLGGLGWLVGRPFDPSIRDGVLATGLSSSEIATVGLVALAGGDAALCLGIVTGSLIVSAIAGPFAVTVLAGATAHVSATHLLGRFALVVLAPLAVGIIIRAARPSVGRFDAELASASTLTVVALVFAALSGVGSPRDLAGAVLASAIFLMACSGLGLLWQRSAPASSGIPGAFVISLRDFAVAAALAVQSFGSAAGTVPGVYGVLMLVLGAAASSRIRRSERGVAAVRAVG